MDVTRQIIEGLRTIGLVADDDQARTMSRHVDLVLEANEHFNLTRISQDDAVPLHIIDSCTAAPMLQAAPDGPFADIGSGAGFPGIPLAVMTGRPVHLVESVGKKAAFLSRVAGELCLNATVHPVRAEELALERANAFAAVTARAVTALPSLVELAAPLLRQGGVLICLKGAPELEEYARGDAAARLCGMRETGRTPVAIPSLDAARVVVTYERCGTPTVRLPRRPGMAQRQPLA